MQVISPRCCGLDVHKKFVMACVMITLGNGQVQKQIRMFSTMTVDLLALADWLQVLEVTVVAMESTGVFWHPVDNILQRLVKILSHSVVNPEVKEERGRRLCHARGRSSGAGWRTGDGLDEHRPDTGSNAAESIDAEIKKPRRHSHQKWVVVTYYRAHRCVLSWKTSHLCTIHADGME